jgi:hypothetical protein
VLCLYLTSPDVEAVAEEGTVDQTSTFYRFAYFTSFFNAQPTDRLIVQGIWAYQAE